MKRWSHDAPWHLALGAATPARAVPALGCGPGRAAPDYGLKHYQLHGIAQRAEKIKEVDIVGHIMNHFSSLPDHGEKMFDPETGAIVNETAWEEALADSRKHAARDFDRGGGALTGHKRPKGHHKSKAAVVAGVVFDCHGAFVNFC